MLHCSITDQKETVFFRRCIHIRVSPDFQASGTLNTLQIYFHVFRLVVSCTCKTEEILGFAFSLLFLGTCGNLVSGLQH